MKKNVVPTVVFIVLVMSSMSCSMSAGQSQEAPVEPEIVEITVEVPVQVVATPTPIQEQEAAEEPVEEIPAQEAAPQSLEAQAYWGEVVMAEDFSQEYLWGQNWSKHVDESVSCGEVLTTDDMTHQLVEDGQRGGNVLLLEANSQQKQGGFGNVIERGMFRGRDGRYRLSVWTKFAPDMVPNSDAVGNELQNIALMFVQDEVAHSAEMFWHLNKLDMNRFGLVFTRTGENGTEPLTAEGQYIDLGMDLDWHNFVLVVTVDSYNGVYTIDSIEVDGEIVQVGVEMPTFEKTGWPDSANIYLETHNVYPGELCDAVPTVGVSAWDDLLLERRSLP